MAVEIMAVSYLTLNDWGWWDYSHEKTRLRAVRGDRDRPISIEVYKILSDHIFSNYHTANVLWNFFVHDPDFYSERTSFSVSESPSRIRQLYSPL